MQYAWMFDDPTKDIVAYLDAIRREGGISRLTERDRQTARMLLPSFVEQIKRYDRMVGSRIRVVDLVAHSLLLREIKGLIEECERCRLEKS